MSNIVETTSLQNTEEWCNQCLSCGKSAQSCNLKENKLTHMDDRPYQCSLCMISFKRQRNLKTHVLIHMGVRPYQCSKCEKTFTKSGNLKKHLLTHMSDQPLSHAKRLNERSVSSKTSQRRSNSKSHVVRKVGLHPYQNPKKKLTQADEWPHDYPELGKLSTIASSGKKHIVTNVGEQLHEYSLCKTSLLRQEEHENEHGVAHKHEQAKELPVFKKPSIKSIDDKLILSNQQSFKCLVCDESFKRSRDLKRHALSHSGGMQHQCPLCDKTFKRSRDVNIHILRHTGEKPHSCSVCQVAFADPSNLKRHMLVVHSGERPHQCLSCEKSFKQAKDLKAHMLKHTGERPHRCSLCHAAFTNHTNLKTHMLRHTGERPHQCSICDKTFTTSSSKKRHMLVHTGERPHECPVCSKTFTEKPHLKVHSLTHTGERPHSCEICEKSFTTTSQLKRHRITHKDPFFSDTIIIFNDIIVSDQDNQQNIITQC